MWTAFQRVLGETGLITQKMSEAALLNKQYTFAEELANKSIALDKRSTWSYIALANLNLKKQNFAEAEKFYNLAKENQPNHEIFKVFATSSSDIQIILEAEQMISQGDLDNALSFLHRKLPHNKSSAILRKYLETLCLKLIPDDPHLDIAIKTEVQMDIMKAQISKVESMLSHVD